MTADNESGQAIKLKQLVNWLGGGGGDLQTCGHADVPMHPGPELAAAVGCVLHPVDAGQLPRLAIVY